jgi:hypothetical protein
LLSFQRPLGVLNRWKVARRAVTAGMPKR